ncbi:hypothetical protein MVEN_01591900 [Mycena venus]|uniref:Uncharacterized protein n=1 Tax=Mycena venus TaxID=2733690 RepID=A0A8H7CSD3_9AGAR|nr:hypothetical protein MVEN_01591900 [Mycena venus]
MLIWYSTMDAAVNPMHVPELLQEVAAFVDDPRDLSSFAQIDRLTHAVVTPRLFRCIELPLESVESLAVALRNDPGRAAACRSLSFLRPHILKAVTAEDTAVLDRWNVDLISVFSAIATHGQLVSLTWRSPLYRRRANVALSEDAWITISSALGSLTELDIYIPSTEKHIWAPISRVHFTQLRVFRLNLSGAHGWDCALLQQTLDSLYLLEELALNFPLCCGPRGITLASTHPHLRRFSFISCSLVEESDFLARHPGLESLYLETEQSFCSGTDASSPKMLRALSTDETSLDSSETLMTYPIIHLCLREIDMDDEYIMGNWCADVVCAVARTLRCLELDLGGLHDVPISPSVAGLLSTAPALAEVTIIRRKRLPLPPNWASNLLTGLLAAIAPATTLRAVRLCCEEALPEERLQDLGPLPPRLKYIGWDVGSTTLVYVIERRGDKNVVANTLTRLSTDDWATEGVLPFMGESWTDW